MIIYFVTKTAVQQQAQFLNRCVRCMAVCCMCQFGFVIDAMATSVANPASRLALLLPFVFVPYIRTSFLMVVPDCNVQVMHTRIQQGDKLRLNFAQVEMMQRFWDSPDHCVCLSLSLSTTSVGTNL